MGAFFVELVLFSCSAMGRPLGGDARSISLPHSNGIKVFAESECCGLVVVLSIVNLLDIGVRNCCLASPMDKINYQVERAMRLWKKRP